RRWSPRTPRPGFLDIPAPGAPGPPARRTPPGWRSPAGPLPRGGRGDRRAEGPPGPSPPRPAPGAPPQSPARAPTALPSAPLPVRPLTLVERASHPFHPSRRRISPRAGATTSRDGDARQPAAEHLPAPAEVGAADRRHLLPALREGHPRPAADRRLV